MRAYLFLLFAVILIASGCSRQNETRPDEQTASEAIDIPFRNDGSLTFLRDSTRVVTIDIEVADTDSSRERGLMQRTSLPEKSGMLFIFPTEEMQSFWMANTPLALDIFFVNADSQIVTIGKYTKPFSSSPVASTAPAKYVVETPAGFADTHGISETDRVTWVRAAR